MKSFANLKVMLALRVAAALASIALCASPLRAAFGYTDNGTDYVVDTGAGLVFQVDKSNGNVVSVVYNGVEYNGPSGKGSEISSGLGSTGTTVSAQSDGSTYVKITLQTDSTNTVVTGLTHYLIVRNGINNIYMATYVTAEPAVGELRWITRLAGSLLPNGPVPSDTQGGTVIESQDVFQLSDGTTRSKYYGDTVTNGKVRAMELSYCGATGTNVGVWMVFGPRESSSGGPFYRDIENQSGGTVNTADQEIYNYMNSGHEQTEAFRMNVINGPYVLVFTTGVAPTLPIDCSFMDNLNLTGWVPSSGRGTVSGTASGIPSGFQGVVGFSNSSAQYWATVSNGSYTCSGMKPGTYNAVLYKGEWEVSTGSVTVTAGTTSTLNLASTETTASNIIFQYGDWDGTPSGFLNAAHIPQMHPTDSRQSSWAQTTFTVGVDPASSFPSIQARLENSPITIKFNLTSAQIADLTLKIGITCAYNNGRPGIGVNSWTSAIPSASSQPNSRSYTVGTYRGNNTTFTYTIPASALVVGTNTMTITPESGSSDLGGWLSAGWVYDAVELDGPATTTAPAAPTGLTATAASSSQINLSWTASSGATSYNVLRATTSGGPYSTVATGVTTTTYSDTGLTASTTYYYVVQAVNGVGTSGNSNEASATTQAAATVPAAPTALTATAARKAGKISLSWTQSTGSGLTNNKVYRGTTTGGPYSLVATISPTTSYNDSGLTSGTTYYYVVTAVNSAGESAYSNQASAKSN